MTTPFEWAMGAVVGGLVTVLVYKRLGAARARDPMLLIGSGFVALRIVLTIGDLLMHGTFSLAWAVLTIAVAYVVQRRWRLFAAPGTA